MKLKNCAIKSWLGAGCLLGTVLLASAVPVTFRVDMSVQTAMGQFEPSTDYVTVGANFNSWSPSSFPLSQNATNANIWEGTVELDAGSWPNYNFIKVRSGIGNQWESIANRYFQVAATDQTLDVVFFNDLVAPPSNHATVKFQVNMSVQTATASFDPVNGPLVVSGSFNDWSLTAAPMTPSVADTNIWECTLDITNNIGVTNSFKYVKNNSIWESSANRVFVMTNLPVTLAVVYFNNVTNLPAEIPLTFSVNMGVQQAFGRFIPGNGDYVEVRGSFLVDGVGSWIGGFALTNDPVNNPLVYSGTWVDTNDTSGSLVSYSFVINGAVWESANRTFTLTSTNAVTRPLAFYNYINDLGPLYISQTGAETALTWPSGTNVNNTVRVQSTTNLLSGWTDVPDTLGQSAVTNDFGSGNHYFRLFGP